MFEVLGIIFGAVIGLIAVHDIIVFFITGPEEIKKRNNKF